MKAVVQDHYGPPEVLRIAEVDRPVPKEHELLIRVRASTVSQTDTHARAAHPFFWRFFAGLRRPRWPTLGVELAGEVEQVGSAVTEFTVGDQVFGSPPGFGAHAEFVCLSDSAALALKPNRMSFEEAAAVCDGASQALAALRRADVRSGQRVLIYGASGSLGTAAVQLARQLGAHVTAVCSARNLELVRSLGADDVIDYEREDFNKRNETYDVVIDAVGKYSFFHCRGALAPAGIYIATDLGRFLLGTPAAILASRLRGRQRVRLAIARRTKADVAYIRKLIEAGEFRAVIDRRYRLEQVIDAHRYVETWQKTGNVVLLVGGDRQAMTSGEIR